MSVVPKRPRGPTLNSLRAFEAAARHSSFALAAEELNVTAAAISQQVKSLEEWAGCSLFNRKAQAISLTTHGRNNLERLTFAFDELAEIGRSLKSHSPKMEFHIATLPSIAQLWLPKKLKSFRAKFPDINLSVTAMETPPNLSRELYDASIFFYDLEHVNKARQTVLLKDYIVPVGSLAVKERFKLSCDFNMFPLLHDQSWSLDWSCWSKKANAHLEDTNLGPKFSLYSLAVEEARAGAGILIGHLCLIQDYLNNGDLFQLHDEVMLSGKALVLETPSGKPGDKHLKGLLEIITKN